MSTETEKFLSALYDGGTGGKLEIRYIAEGKRTLQRWVDPSSAPFPRMEAANKSGYNVYFGVGLRAGSGQGDKKAVATLPALWVDLDGKDFASKEEAGGALGKLPGDLAPSIVLDSGHGYHAYWLLSEPADLNGDGKAALDLEAIMKGLASALGGDSSVADVARIMRLPGFLNTKDPANPVPCEIVSLAADRRFTLEQFAAYKLETAAPAVQGTRPDRPVLPRRALDFLAQGATAGDRNDTAFYTACQLRDAGYSQAEALDMVLAGSARSTPPADIRETTRTVESAFSPKWNKRKAIADNGNGQAKAAKPAKKAAKQPDQPAGIQVQPPDKSFSFFWTPDKRPVLTRWSASRDGSTRYQVPIAWFIPRVLSEKIRHKANGETARDLDLEIQTWRSTVTARIDPETIADARRFYSACVRACGADARLIDPGATKYLAQAALELAPSDRERSTIYEMTGWQEIDGKLCYLSPAGGVRQPANVHVDLGNLEAGIGLSQAGLSIQGVADKGDQAFQEGIESLISMLDSYPRSVTLPAVGFVFLAPLMRWSPIPDRPALHFVGSTGTRKTALLGVLQSFYGCPRFLLSWQSTGNSLEIAMSQTRDMLITVDDLKQNMGDRNIGRRVIQSYADRSGRGRATSRGELAAARFAGGLMASAGEDIPEGEASIAARSLFVTIAKGAANLERITVAQEAGAAGALATVTARYIAWLLDSERGGAISVAIRENREYFREGLGENPGVNDAGRVATSCALILTGMQQACAFLQECQAIQPELLQELETQTRIELLELGIGQARIMVRESYAQGFISAVRTLIETRGAYLVPVEQGQPLEGLEHAKIPGNYPTTAKACGWELEHEIWLRPDAIWAEVASFLSRQGKAMPSREGLYRQLDDIGALARKSGDKSTYVAKVGAKSARVLALLKSALDER